MKYVSIDIETSGLNSEKNCVLSIGAIIEDTLKKLSFDEIPKFYGIINQKEINGSPRAISMNKKIIDLIADYNDGNQEVKESIVRLNKVSFYEENEIVKQLYKFLIKSKYDEDYKFQIKLSDGSIIIDSKTSPIVINVAGKNFGTFDKLFLEKLPWFQKLIRLRQRIIDPAILCCDWNNDDKLPSLDECKQRLSIDGEVSHNALEDAWDVIKVMRNYY